MVYGMLAAVNLSSLADIKRRYVLEGRSLDAAMEAALKADPRPGARAILPNLVGCRPAPPDRCDDLNAVRRVGHRDG